jgi:hypothetical protein
MKGILKPTASLSDDRSKYCVYCGILVTQEAFFDAGNGVIVVEKYCHDCNGRANLRLDASSYHHDFKGNSQNLLEG